MREIEELSTNAHNSTGLLDKLVQRVKRFLGGNTKPAEISFQVLAAEAWNQRWRQKDRDMSLKNVSPQDYASYEDWFDDNEVDLYAEYMET
ncbi:uncharacterized protein METZ01_LOCUS382875, partial [marine metagenome]